MRPPKANGDVKGRWYMLSVIKQSQICGMAISENKLSRKILHVNILQKYIQTDRIVPSAFSEKVMHRQTDSTQVGRNRRENLVAT